ncbi:MAG: carbohydrate kinase family protein [Promethearchaeota archaeon]|nr:MAG: carbohydrate kinase family protein [Candidatus Lokiarchaeota archaeon]
MVKELDVICIGAALVDIVAKVNRHPIDDDEVFVSDLKLFSGGAAANTAYVCAKLGLKVAFIGKLGHNDEFGKKILEDFKKVSLNLSLITYSENFGTGSAYVALTENGERRIYAYSGAANTLSIKDIKSEDILKANTLFLSSLKNTVPLKKAAKIAQNNNIPVILNPGMLIIEQGFDRLKNFLMHIDILIISRREFCTLFDLGENDFNNQVREKAKSIFKLGIKTLIITLGKEGAMLITLERSELVKPIEKVQAVDTTGAGDAFSAGFLYSFIKNFSFKFEDIKCGIKIGNFVAGRCIQKLGARKGIPSTNDLILKSLDR